MAPNNATVATWPRSLRAAAVLLICLLSALAATWPLVLFPTSTIPIGTEREATVPLASLWSLWWTADRAWQGFAGYWDAPIFYPNQGVFTFSEPNILAGLVVAPFWGAGLAPALIYNSALLGILICNGIFAYRLARAFALTFLSALIGAVLTTMLPFAAKQYGVLPLTGLFGMLWTLEGLVRFGRSGSWRSAAWAGAGLLACYLTCQQYTLMFVPFACTAVLLALSQQHFQQSSLARLLSCSLFAGGIILILAWPALSIHGQFGFQRSDQIVQALSAQPTDLLTRPSTALVPFPPTDPADTAGLFPGVIALILAAAGATFGITNRQQRPWALYLLCSTLAALVLAMGLNLTIGGWRPFASLRSIVPGLNELRAPFRYMAIGQLCLIMLATLGLSGIQSMVRINATLLIIALGILGAFEQLAPPALVEVPPSPRTAWTAWLRSQPPNTAIAHVPFPMGLNVANYEIDAWRMFAQIDHGKPIANGYSSYFPQAQTPDGQIIPTYTHFQLTMAQRFPEQDLLCTLHLGLGVNTLVVDQPWLAAHHSQLNRFGEFLQPIYQDQSVQIYRLQAPVERCQR